jgi:hypothetical protein
MSTLICGNELNCTTDAVRHSWDHGLELTLLNRAFSGTSVNYAYGPTSQSITQSVVFLSFNNSTLCLLQISRHTEEFITYEFALHFTRGIEFSLPLNFNILYTQSFHCECMFVIYCQRKSYTYYCSCVGLVNLHFIPQVHYIKNTPDNNSYGTHTSATEINFYRTLSFEVYKIPDQGPMTFRFIMVL